MNSTDPRWTRLLSDLAEAHAGEVRQRYLDVALHGLTATTEVGGRVDPTSLSVPIDVIPGFPACSHGHAVANMRLLNLERLGDRQQETWGCFICCATTTCEVGTREIPRELRVTANA